MGGKRIFEARMLVEGIAVGIGAGLVVSIFRYLLDASAAFRDILYGQWMEETPLVTILWFLALLLAAFAIRWMMRACPVAAGSGIPQVKGLLRGKLDLPWGRVLPFKFIGAVLGIGAGLSLGRQGPSVQFGACVGQAVGCLRGRPGSREERCLITAGAGAGLAAAFNAPLAGTVFCLEELSHRFSSMQILVGIIAAAAATAVSHVFFDEHPVFRFGELLPMVPLGIHYIHFIGLGVFCGFLGLVFNRGLLLSLDMYDRIHAKGLPKPLLPLLLAGLLGFVLPEILGGGDILVNQLLESNISLRFLLLLFAAKFLFTLLCFGSGTPGGIFLPMMALGAASGAIYAKAAVFFGWLDPSWELCCIVFGMAAYFSGAVKSPVSSSILIMEITGSFSNMLILLCVSLSACMVLDMARVRPVYNALLERQLREKKKAARKSIPQSAVDSK